MTASKAVILKGMFRLSDLPIEVEDDTVRILWFQDKPMSEEETRLATDLVEAMFRKCQQQRYVNPTPLESDNLKYNGRVWLNSLGYIGPEYKSARAALLKDLAGSTAWRHGKPERKMNGNQN